MISGANGSSRSIKALSSSYLADNKKLKRIEDDSVLNVPPEQHHWGWYHVATDKTNIRKILHAKPEKHPAEMALKSTRLLRVYDPRFRTAMIVHPSKATYASASDAGAIILYLPGASCVHSQATAMISQLTLFSKRGYPGVSIDHAFHGHGPRDAAFYNLATYMSWIHRIVEYSKKMYADVPIGIFGRSTGANLALEFASRYPGEAAFVIAMSGYDPAWTPYSVFHIKNMQAKGDYEVNEKGLEWVNTIDEQWTWTDPRRSAVMGHNNVLLLAGNRDDEYPWYRHQAEGEFAKGYQVPPTDADPYYIQWWREQASRIGAEIAVIPNASHNLFDGHNPVAMKLAQETTLDFLRKTVPAAGKQYFVGRPFQFGSTIMKLPSSLEELKADAETLRSKTEKESWNLTGQLCLTILYQALSQSSEISAEDVKAYQELAEEFYLLAFPKIHERASYLLLGKPVSGDMMQVAVREFLATFDPVKTLPTSPSVEAFISLLRDDVLPSNVTHDGALVNGTVYDFQNRPLHLEVHFRGQQLDKIVIAGEEAPLKDAKEFWERNALLFKTDDLEASLRGIPNRPGIRNGISLQSESGKLILTRSEKKKTTDSAMLVRFAELFFEYWPHPTVKDFVRRLDQYTLHDGGETKERPMPQFDFVREETNILVHTPTSSIINGSTLSLTDLSSLVEYQKRNPNVAAFSGRRSADPERPVGTFDVATEAGAEVSAPAPVSAWISHPLTGDLSFSSPFAPNCLLPANGASIYQAPAIDATMLPMHTLNIVIGGTTVPMMARP